MRTCRFCGESGDRLVKYEVRHYAHGGCLLDARGRTVFGSLSLNALENFPYFAAKDRGMEDALMAEVERREPRR